jgi:hypothetical protein
MYRFGGLLQGQGQVRAAVAYQLEQHLFPRRVDGARDRLGDLSMPTGSPWRQPQPLRRVDHELQVQGCGPYD